MVGLLRAHGWQSAGFAQKLSTATRRSSAGSTPCFFKMVFFKATSKTHKEESCGNCGLFFELRNVTLPNDGFQPLRLIEKKSTSKIRPTDLTTSNNQTCDRVPGHHWVELEPVEWEAINATGSVYLHSPWLLYCCARFLANAKRK